MSVIDIAGCPVRTGSIYPEPYAAMMAGRSSRRLGEAGGLTQFGVNLVTLDPGALSSLRHWHAQEDEFVMVTEGRCTLIDDTGATELGPGDCAAFPAGVPNGHQIVNRSGAVARFLVVGSRAAREEVRYSDVDLCLSLDRGVATFRHRDGTPYAPPPET